MEALATLISIDILLQQDHSVTVQWETGQNTPNETSAWLFKASVPYGDRPFVLALFSQLDVTLCGHLVAMSLCQISNFRRKWLFEGR
jgi:hypothetical protein